MNTAQDTTGTVSPSSKFQSIIARVKEILTHTDAAWEKIKGEPSTINSIYRDYLLVLAAIGPIFGFIKGSIIGYSFYNITYRETFFRGLVDAVLQYGFGLLMIYVMALILEKLAPKFGGSANILNSFKLVAYSYTPAFLAGAFIIVPYVAILVSIVAVILSIFIFFKGLPKLITIPADRQITYIVASVLCMIVATFILGLIVAAVSPARSPATFRYGNNQQIDLNELEDNILRNLKAR